MHQGFFAFLSDQARHDFVLQRLIKRGPYRAKQIFLGQHRRGGVALELGTLGVFQVELHRIAQLELFAHGLEGHLTAAFQQLHDGVALRQAQRLLAQVRVQHTQVVHLLQDAKALRAGQGQWGTLFIGQQGAAPRLDRAQRALVQQRVTQFGAGLLVEQRGV